MRKNRGNTLIEVIVALGILMIALGALNTLVITVIRTQKSIQDANRKLDIINMVSKELLFNISDEQLVSLQQTIRLDSKNKDMLMNIKEGSIFEILMSQNTPDGDIEFIFTKEELWRFDIFTYKYGEKTYLCSFYRGELFESIKDEGIYPN